MTPAERRQWEPVDAGRWVRWDAARLDEYERATGTRLEHAAERVAVYPGNRVVCEVITMGPVGRGSEGE